jgi:hypothetical protein
MSGVWGLDFLGRVVLHVRPRILPLMNIAEKTVRGAGGWAVGGIWGRRSVFMVGLQGGLPKALTESFVDGVVWSKAEVPDGDRRSRLDIRLNSPGDEVQSQMEASEAVVP